MIHEEICTYEVCKLAKEKGFPQLGIDSNDYWFEDNNDKLIDMNVNAFIFDVIPKEGLTRKIPQNLLQRWLREEKGLCVSVEAYPTLAIMGKVCFAWVIKSGSDGHFMESNDSLQTFPTYELALEDALKYALENLVI